MEFGLGCAYFAVKEKETGIRGLVRNEKKDIMPVKFFIVEYSFFKLIDYSGCT